MNGVALCPKIPKASSVSKGMKPTVKCLEKILITLFLSCSSGEKRRLLDAEEEKVEEDAKPEKKKNHNHNKNQRGKKKVKK